VAAIGSSRHYDGKLARYDITVPQAHVAMVLKPGILPADAAAELQLALAEIEQRIRSGADLLDPDAEDVDTVMEQYLAAQIGTDAGRRPAVPPLKNLV
jgi:argininosuccinate lyase